MDLQLTLLSEHSRANADRIAGWIGTDKKRFEQLMQLFLKEEYRLAQRSAAVLSICGQQHPSLVQPYIGRMLERCAEAGVPDAVKRNVTRILQFIPIPEDHKDSAMNLCFELLCNPKEAVAIRCFSMSILAELSAPYPEIKQELRHIIEEALEHQEVSAAFRNRGQKIIRQLSEKKNRLFNNNRLRE